MQLYKDCIWEMPSDGNKVYLSFDDGPHPVATAFVLDLLKAHNATGNFFCIGNNVIRYPEVYRRIIDEGHVTGNHTHHHKNGWKTGNDDYLNDIRQAQQFIDSDLFRPPYGRIRYGQLKRIKTDLGLKPVMWSLLSGDFDPDLTGAECAGNILKNARPGDIIVFHDSEKALERLRYALPLVLDAIRERGWVTEKL
jgi:peptidoglycan-N-acetylglucosamine deacetylase